MSARDDTLDITTLILHERQGRDRGWWSQMGAVFASDSVVRLSWYRGDGAGFVAGSERMSAGGDRAVHRLSPATIHVRNDRAIAEMPCGVELQVRINGITAHLVSYTRLNYRLRKRQGSWFITELEAIYERDTLTPALPGDRLVVNAADVGARRPSYALLAHYLASKGYDIANDLLGDDRPQDVERFYDDLRRWLHASDDDTATAPR